MKRLVLTLTILLAFALCVVAQNVWKPIGMEGEFLGASADGSIFSNWGYSGLHRSQDEGATWELNYDLSYVSSKSFMISENNRIFIFNENNYRLYYSDDNGDTWQGQTSGISTNWVEGIFPLSNDTIFMANRYKFFWTFDGGESWSETTIDFIDDAQFGSILADHAGNVYVSTYSWTIPVEHTGIYTSTVDDLTQWTVKTQGGARDMAFDSQGNILAASPTFMFDNGVYFVNADRFALASDDVIFAMKRVDWDNEALFYSTDHGETYTQCSNLVPSTTTAPDPDLGLFKGRDNHLYCHGDVWEPEFERQYYKSVQIVDFILNDCDAPENFSGQYQQTPNGNQYAVLSWENPMHDFWFHYDEEPMSGAVDVAYWGIKIPAETFEESPCELKKVMLYKTNCQNQEGSYYVKIYFGEDSPGTMVEIEHHTLESGPDEWVELELTAPVVCTSSNSVWIVIETDGLSNVAAYCPTAGDPNGRWAWSAENGWHDYYAETGQGGDWMIRAFFEFYAKDDNLVDHFNIYRGENLNTMEHLTEVSKYANTYWDDLTDAHGNYYYRLTASYENGCESAYALDVEHPENDYVNIYVPGGMFVGGPEWYYEIQNENGSITYQYMYQAGDTIVQDEPTQILVKINTLYDKDIHTEVTHEYVYERDGKLYWWNKTLEEFTVLYDLGAQEGDNWVIKVGTETLTMHVDAVDYIEYEGVTYRVLHVSDPEDIFSGDIVCGIGHLTSFFPERLMDNGDGVRVEGLRCYWLEDELVFKIGDEDCDAIYDELHGIEDGPSTGSGTLKVYPNPTNGILFVETFPETSRNGMYVSSETFQETSLPTQTYRIINLMGQTLMTGNITAETQQIDVTALPDGMYFITVGDTIRKFVVKK